MANHEISSMKHEATLDKQVAPEALHGDSNMMQDFHAVKSESMKHSSAAAHLPELELTKSPTDHEKGKDLGSPKEHEKSPISDKAAEKEHESVADKATQKAAEVDSPKGAAKQAAAPGDNDALKEAAKDFTANKHVRISTNWH
jgi:hypothetical protein